MLIRRLILALLLLLGSIWFVATQPLFNSQTAVTTSPFVDPNILESHVKNLSENLGARAGNEQALQPTLEWIEQQLKPLGESRRQSFQANGENFHNILLAFGPPSPELTIVGAHYDTAHGYPGADDNASGVATLIELARLLSQHQDALKGRVQLVFYTLEEPPYFRTNKMGSFIHAAQLKADNITVKMMIALDMVGYFSDEKNSQLFPFPPLNWFYPNRGDFITVVGNLNNMSLVRQVKSHFKKASDLGVYSINAPDIISGIDFSDHLNFWHHGYPAIMITDTSFNRNLAYHTIHDTANRLDYQKMAKVTQGLFHTVMDQ